MPPGSLGARSPQRATTTPHDTTSRMLRAVCAALALLVAFAPPAGADYHVLRRATLGGEGGWDLITVDGATHRLYVPRSTHVMIVDTDSLKVVGDVPNTPGAHAVALVPGLNRGFTTNGRDTSVTIFDLTTLKTLDRV